MQLDEKIINIHSELCDKLQVKAAPLTVDDLGANKAPQEFDGSNYMAFVDLTNLKAFSTAQDITELCHKAKEQGAKAVCVNPSRVSLAAKELNGTDILPICVVGFPLGNTLPEALAAETKACIQAGAKEIDMVIPTGHLKEADDKAVFTLIKACVDAAGDIPVKVILETCYLLEDEIMRACLIARLADATFVKTSTGFGTESIRKDGVTGATPQHIKLMRRCVGNAMGVKASGGVKTATDASAVLEAGANRIGASGLNTDSTY